MAGTSPYRQMDNALRISDEAGEGKPSDPPHGPSQQIAIRNEKTAEGSKLPSADATTFRMTTGAKHQARQNPGLVDEAVGGGGAGAGGLAAGGVVAAGVGGGGGVSTGVGGAAWRRMWPALMWPALMWPEPVQPVFRELAWALA